MTPPYIIAEAGSCHDGSLEQALDLIQAASRTSVNAVKFQFWSNPTKLAAQRGIPHVAHVYHQYQLPEQWLPQLASAAHREALDFMCTVYLPEDIAVVAPFVDRFKISAFESQNESFVQAHRPYADRLIVSVNPDQLLPPWGYLLHCISKYPTPIEELRLGLIRERGLDGLSDHTGNVNVGAWAVCAGARILEVHFRGWNTRRENPDWQHSHDPRGLYKYCERARDAIEAL